MLFSCDKDLRGQSPSWKPWTIELVQEGDVPGTPRNKPLLSAMAQITVK